MKNIYEKYVILFFLAIIFFCASCASRKVNVAQDEIEYTIPTYAENTPPPVVSEQNPFTKQSSSSSMHTTTPTSDNSDYEREIWGYRVELLSSTDKTLAEQTARDASNLLKDESIYIQFDHPYYKVRVGNCSNKNEAGALLQKVKRAGFSNASVVRAIIVPQRR